MPTVSSTSKIESLRVAQAELCSGDTSGAVYLQLSPGSVIHLTDRSLAIDLVSRKIQETIRADDNDKTSKKD